MSSGVIHLGALTGIHSKTIDCYIAEGQGPKYRRGEFSTARPRFEHHADQMDSSFKCHLDINEAAEQVADFYAETAMRQLEKFADFRAIAEQGCIEASSSKDALRILLAYALGGDNEAAKGCFKSIEDVFSGSEVFQEDDYALLSRIAVDFQL